MTLADLNVVATPKAKEAIGGGNDQTQQTRDRMLNGINKQKELVNLYLQGKELPFKARKWFYRAADGNYYIDVRYGNRPLPIKDNNNTVLAGDKREDLLNVLDVLEQAVTDGELDTQMEAARKRKRED